MEFEARRLQPNSTIVGVRIQANEEEESRKPVHLALLLDTSGSMEGDRLAAVQQTLRVLIERLSDSDALTLITYNSEATLLCHAESNKARLLELTNTLVADGGTNLESALLALGRLGGDRSPQAVFLLTDGHINQGARSPTALCQLVKAALRDPSVPVSTLGYGEDHAATTLQQIALSTRGTYTFAEAAELIPSVVGDMLAAVETVVLQDVHVTAGEGAECLELTHTAGSGSKNTNTYWLGNLISNKTQWVLLDVPPTVGPAIVIKATAPVLTMTTDVVNVSSYQSDVAEQWFRCRTVKALHQASHRVTGHAVGPIIGRLVALESEMMASPVASSPLVLSLRASITDMIKQLEGATTNPAAALRMLSNVTTMGTQRGLLVPDPLHMGGPGGLDSQHMFQSPRQRYVSNSLVSGFSQAMTEP